MEAVAAALQKDVLIPTAKLMPAPEPERIGRMDSAMQEDYGVIYNFTAEEGSTPVIVEITTASEPALRKFSILRCGDTYDRVTVHAPTAKAVKCDGNIRATCSNRGNDGVSSFYLDSMFIEFLKYESLYCSQDKNGYFGPLNEEK